jgi:hypothetical protein
MAPRHANRQLGIGAIVSCLAKSLHPSRDVKSFYGDNEWTTRRISNLIVDSKAFKTVNRKEIECLIVRHDDFPNQLLHVSIKCAKLEQAGAPEHFFSAIPQVQPPVPMVVEDEEEARPEGILASSRTRLGDDDLCRIVHEGFTVDDDNMPAVENNRSGNEIEEHNNEIIWSEWGFQGLDLRHESCQQTNANPRIPQFEDNNLFYLFWKFFPKDYILNVVLPQTNKNLLKELKKGEFTRFLGLVLLISTVTGSNHRDFWATADISAFEGAPFRFNIWMTRTRFEEILNALRFTDSPVPTYNDKFFSVRQLIAEFNKNMSAQFVPSWISCLDESMCAWTSKYTCPGWMVVPRKPHPYGNEYHTICCGISGIMYYIELVEGKDRPRELPLQYSEKGKTSGLLLRMTSPIHGTGKVVIMDSGFCVLDALLALKSVGVFGSALIKKRRYWPKGIDGDEINRHMAGKEVGECNAIKGVKMAKDSMCMV